MNNKVSKKLISEASKKINCIQLQHKAAIERVLIEFRAQVEKEALEQAAKKFDKMNVYKDIREAVVEDLRKMVKDVKS